MADGTADIARQRHKDKVELESDTVDTTESVSTGDLAVGMRTYVCAGASSTTALYSRPGQVRADAPLFFLRRKSSLRDQAAPDGRCLYPVLADRLTPAKESPSTSFEAISHRRVRGPDPNTRALRKSLKSHTPAQVAIARVKAVTCLVRNTTVPSPVTRLPGYGWPASPSSWPSALSIPPVLLLKLPPLLLPTLGTVGTPCTPVPQSSVNPPCCCGPSHLLSSLSLFCACSVGMYDTHLRIPPACLQLQLAPDLTLIPRHAVCHFAMVPYLPTDTAGPIPLTRRSPHLPCCVSTSPTAQSTCT